MEKTSDILHNDIYFSFQSSISGAGTDIGTSASALLHQQSITRNVHGRHLNEYLTVFV
jgi:hypothetical protein